MKNHRMLLVFLAVVVTVSLVLCSCAAPAPAPAPKPAPAPAPKPTAPSFNLKFTSGYPPPPFYQSTCPDAFMDAVTEATGGRVTWQKFWGGALASIPESMDMVRSGAADCGISQYAVHTAEFPLFELERNFMFGPIHTRQTMDGAWAIYDNFQQFRDQGMAQNQIMIFFGPIGAYHLLSLEPIKTLADFEGKIIGSWGRFMPKYFSPIGASAVGTPGTDRYLNLKQKLLDASCYTSLDSASFKLYEVGKHYTKIGLIAPIAFNFSVNLDTWNQFDQELKDLFFKLGRENSYIYVDKVDAMTGDAEKTMKDNGVTFYELSDADKAEWAALCEYMPWEWIEELEAKGLPGAAMLQTFYDAAAKSGYKWEKEWKFVQ